jgi:4-amino-4-deoxy-L-arabinose transferase-like glycosyltransferase
MEILQSHATVPCVVKAPDDKEETLGSRHISAVNEVTPEKAQRTQSHLRVILLLAVVARIGVALVLCEFSRIPPLTSWGFENIAIALSLHSGHGYSSPFFSDSGPTALMAPAYPLFLAAIMAVFGTGSAAATIVVVLQEIFSLVTVLVVFYAARRQFGERTANLAGFLCALAPPMLIAPIRIWDTSLSALLLTGIFAAASASLLPRMKFSLAGALCAFAGLVNPALIPSLVAICGWTAWKARTFPWAGILSFLIVFTPWPLRNEVVMHSFIPLRTDFGYQLWIGNHPGGNGDFDETMNPMMSAAERQAFVSRGELGYFKAEGDLAKAFIANHPTKFLSLTMKRIGQFWAGAEGGESPTTVPIFLLALGGMTLLLRRKGLATLYAFPLLFFPLPYYITHVYVRFQYVIDPLLLILAAHAIETFLSWLRPKGES